MNRGVSAVLAHTCLFFLTMGTLIHTECGPLHGRSVRRPDLSPDASILTLALRAPPVSPLRGGSGRELQHTSRQGEHESDVPQEGNHELECPMQKLCHGFASNGVMFDVEAVGGDIFIHGIKVACDDDKGPGLYEVLVCEKGPWMDAGFQRSRNRSEWRSLMRSRRLQLADNPLFFHDNGDVELSYGNYSSLPFDEDETGALGGVVLRKGERKALYVHGRLPGAVVFRHPIRHLVWDFDEADKNGYDAVWTPDVQEVIQWHYDADRSLPVQTENDGRLAVYAGTSFWDSDPFSTFCPIAECDEPEVHSVAGFVGNISYTLL